MTIPNVIHFICIKPMIFSFFHFLAVASANVTQKPNKIFIYYDTEQEDNIYWETVKQFCTIEQIDPPLIFGGKEVTAPQYKADIIRLEKLIERGGIYLDLDILCLKSFDDFLGVDKCVMTGRPEGCQDDISILNETQNSIIMAPKYNPFLIKWYETMDEYMNGEYPWSYHAVIYPAQIIRGQINDNTHHVKILDCDKLFMPFGWEDNDPFIFKNINEISVNEKLKLNGYYTIMFFETIVKCTYLKNITLQHIIDNNNLFSHIFIKYISLLKKKSNLLWKLMWKNFDRSNWENSHKMANDYVYLLNKNISDNNVRWATFIKASSELRMEKYSKSKSAFHVLLKLNNLDQNLKIQIENNLALIEDIKNKKKDDIFKNIQNSYHSKDYDDIIEKCEEYYNLLLEGNYQYQNILFFLSTAHFQKKNYDKSKKLHETILNVKDIDDNVKIWVTSNYDYLIRCINES